MMTPRPSLTSDPSGRKCRLASLYGAVILKTSSTPSSNSMSRVSKSTLAPTAPSTVWRAPVERWISNPIPINRLITYWICLFRRAFLHHYDHRASLLSKGTPALHRMPFQ